MHCWCKKIYTVNQSDIMVGYDFESMVKFMDQSEITV